MALYTLQAGMFPVQFKPGIVVVKSLRRPVFEGVAPLTVILAVLHKLAGMNIFMAVFAARAEIPELLCDFPG